MLETAVSRGPLIRAPGPSRVDKHVPVRTGVLLLVCGLRTQEPDVSSLFLTSKTKTPRGEEEPSRTHTRTRTPSAPALVGCRELVPSQDALSQATAPPVPAGGLFSSLRRP